MWYAITYPSFIKILSMLWKDWCAKQPLTDEPSWMNWFDWITMIRSRIILFNPLRYIRNSVPCLSGNFMKPYSRRRRGGLMLWQGSFNLYMTFLVLFVGLIFCTYLLKHIVIYREIFMPHFFICHIFMSKKVVFYFAKYPCTIFP